MDDPNEDPQTPERRFASSDETPSSVGPSGNQSVRRLREKVTYYEKLSSGGKKRTGGDCENSDDGGIEKAIIDVQAFEQRLHDERARRIQLNSPRIEVKLRHTPQSSPIRHRNIDLPTTLATNRNNINVKVNVIQQGRSSGDTSTADIVQQSDRSISSPDSYEECIERTVDEGELHGNARIFKFEKITLKKTVREVNIVGGRITETFSRTPSEEHVFHDDSAYHTHYSNVLSNTSKSSSIHSMHGVAGFLSSPDEEYTDSGKLSSRERISDDTDMWFKNGGAIAAGASSVTGTIQSSSSSSSGKRVATADVSLVAGGNLSKRRQQFSSSTERFPTIESHDDSSQDWYNEYKAHSFQTAAAKMSFKRTNSQYDTHIKEIRGEPNLIFL